MRRPGGHGCSEPKDLATLVLKRPKNLSCSSSFLNPGGNIHISASEQLWVVLVDGHVVVGVLALFIFNLLNPFRLRHFIPNRLRALLVVVVYLVVGWDGGIWEGRKGNEWA